MSKWKEYKLSNLCIDISYGYTQSASIEEIGPKFLRITDIVPNRINWDTVPYCKISKDNFKKYKLEIDDIVIARTGATTGYNKTIKDNVPSVFASYLIRYKINKELADSSFVGYNLQSNNWYDYVDAISGGSAQPGANAKQLGSFDILLPPLPEQRAIAVVLSSLDDKIDLLHRQNETLEKMAETLFRQWFIEEAKEEWEERSLSSIATFLNGLACQKYPPKNEIDKLPVLKIKELSSGINESSDWASTKIAPEYFVRNGEVIFAWSASLMVKIWDGQDCILNQHLFKVSSTEFPKWFIYLWCKHHLTQFIAIAKAHATTMGHIKRGDLDAAGVSIPTANEITEMTHRAGPLIDRVITNNKQIHTLTNLRNTLLPKLMSGEVRVKI